MPWAVSRVLFVVSKRVDPLLVSSQLESLTQTYCCTIHFWKEPYEVSTNVIVLLVKLELMWVQQLARSHANTSAQFELCARNSHIRN